MAPLGHCDVPSYRDLMLPVLRAVDGLGKLTPVEFELAFADRTEQAA